MLPSKLDEGHVASKEGMEDIREIIVISSSR